MNEEINSKNDQSLLEKSPNKKSAKASSIPRKIKKSPTEKVVQAQGTVKQSEMVKWTIFVRPEVRNAVRMAAKKAGISDTAWMDMQLWELATADLKRKPQPPAKPEDVADMVNKIADQLRADQEAATKAQTALIEQQGQQIAALAEAVKNNQPRSIKEILFGKSES